MDHKTTQRLIIIATLIVFLSLAISQIGSAQSLWEPDHWHTATPTKEPTSTPHCDVKAQTSIDCPLPTWTATAAPSATPEPTDTPEPPDPTQTPWVITGTPAATQTPWVITTTPQPTAEPTTAPEQPYRIFMPFHSYTLQFGAGPWWIPEPR